MLWLFPLFALAAADFQVTFATDVPGDIVINVTNAWCPLGAAHFQALLQVCSCNSTEEKKLPRINFMTKLRFFVLFPILWCNSGSLVFPQKMRSGKHPSKTTPSSTAT